MLEKKHSPSFILLFLVMFCIHPAQAIELKVKNLSAYPINIEGSFLHLETANNNATQYLKNPENISPSIKQISLVSIGYPENFSQHNGRLSGVINYKYTYSCKTFYQIYFKCFFVLDEYSLYHLHTNKATISRLDASGTVLETAYAVYENDGESLIFTISDNPLEHLINN